MKAVTGAQCLVLSVVMVACGWACRTENTAAVKKLIQAQIDESVEATRTKNIDLYMSVIPDDWVVHDEKGGTVSRDDLRRGALEQWDIIEKTISIWRHVDRLEVHENKATVWTSQR